MLQSLSVNRLIHVDNVIPLAEDDYICLEEVRDVLKRYKKLDRFGVNLLHKHFELKENEVLLESCDEHNRVLTIEPVAKELLSESTLLETSWHLSEFTPLLGCNAFCVKAKADGKHEPKHQYTQIEMSSNVKG